MTAAYTYARTRTYARLILLKEQVRTMLRRTTSISPEALDRLTLGIERQWISTFYVYAFNNRNLCRAEAIFEIDWNEYELQMSHGKTTVIMDEKWVDNTAIEVDEIVKLFNDFVRTYNLKTEWRVVFAPWVYSDGTKLIEVRGTLGLGPADQIKWAGKKEGTYHQIPELPEARVGCYLADE